MNFPQELKYTKTHEWVRFEDDTTACVGITDYAQDQLGDLVFANLPEEGDDVVAGDTFADVESVKAVSDVISPVTGVVEEVNIEKEKILPLTNAQMEKRQAACDAGITDLPMMKYAWQFAEADEGNTSSDAARHLPLEGKAEEEPTPVMRGRETIKLQERAKSESRSEAVKKQKAAEREFKIRVAERLREARTHGVKVGDIVTASCGAVPDGAVLTILDGGFRPIADYRALDAALDQLAVEK